MAGFFDKFLRRKPQAPPRDDRTWQEYVDQKQSALEQVLGPMADVVSHALIPFHLGGQVDIYFFPHVLPGTAFVTQELVEPGHVGPKPGPLGPYELIAFTKIPFSESQSPAFDAITRRVCGIFTTLGNYSRQSILRPLETVELPGEKEADTSCLILNEWRNTDADFMVGTQRYGLLLCIEVFRSEMEFAKHNGSRALIDRLKAAGHYPYSEMARSTVA